MGKNAVCPTKILIFDLDRDELIHKYVVPADQVLYGKAALVTPIVDIGKTCLDAYLYVADVDQNGIFVYDLYKNYSWRLSNTAGNAFGPDMDAMNITIAGESFDLTDGTLGMSLSPVGFYDHRCVIKHSSRIIGFQDYSLIFLPSRCTSIRFRINWQIILRVDRIPDSIVFHREPVFGRVSKHLSDHLPFCRSPTHLR